MTTIEPLTTAPQVPLGAWRIDPVHSTIGFEVRDMAHLFATVRGVFTDFDAVVEVTPDGVGASGVIRVGSLTTHHAGRDEKLLSAAFLDAAKGPEIRFTADPFQIADDGAVRVAGSLAIKGIPSDVELDGRVLGCGTDRRGDERLAIAAEGALPFGPMHVKLIIDVSAVKEA